MIDQTRPAAGPLAGRPWAGTVAVVAVALVLPLVAAGCSSDRAPVIGGSAEVQKSAATGGDGGDGGAGGAVAPRATRVPVRTTVGGWAHDAMSVPPARIEPVSEVAQAVVGAVKIYRAPTDVSPWKTLTNPLPSKAPSVFLVQQEQRDWLRVLVPVRPNGSQGWIRRQDVKLYRHDYRIVVSVSKHTLTAYKGTAVVVSEPVGLGTSTTPTPGGVFYTKELLRPPNPNGAYGPYAYGLSGFSPVLNEFLGGDGEIGIHGTNDPGGLGKNVSHGCIRLSNAAITKLATTLPLGVPVQIVR